MLTRILIITSMIFSIYITDLHGKTLSINGQFSGWLTYSEDLPGKTNIGLRYVPELRVSEKNIDVEAALNSYTSAPVDSLADAGDNAQLKPYRLWVRYATSQFEARLGLQKINFGPAKILRSLMWFDQLDIRDPLQITGGVYAGLMRYYFLNNANIWVWGLYGNEEPKGLEIVKTNKNRAESGGRYQFPLPKGEMAFTLNRRYVDPIDWANNSITNQIASTISDGLESRFAIDGNWDIEIGLWFETSLSETKINQSQSLWQNSITIGTDYTLGIGPGVYVSYENMLQSSGPEIDRLDNIINVSALLVNFNVTMMDSINAIGYYDWKGNGFYSFIGWQRTYDNWLFNLMFFASPDVGTGSFSGKGLQFMVTYNH